MVIKYTLKSFNIIKPIPKPHFYFYISNDINSTKIYDEHDEFEFEIVNFSFKMVMFFALHPMEIIFLNSSILLEHLAFLQTSTLVINI